MYQSSCSPARSTGQLPERWLLSIPYVVGYPPDNSLVALYVEHDDVVFTVRMDWADAVIDPGSAAAMASRGAPRTAAGVWLVAVRPFDCEVARQLVALQESFGRQGRPVLWVGTMTENSWWGLECMRVGCPTHQLPDPEQSDVVLGMVLNGAAPAASREAITDEVKPTAAAEKVEIPPAPVEVEVWRDAAVEQVMGLLRGAEQVTPTSLGAFAAACADIRVRDTVLHRVTGRGVSDPEIWWHTWAVASEAVRRVPDSHLAAVGCVAALAAWQLGDGLRAQETLRATRRADPGHRLSNLLREALAAPMAPTEWTVMMSRLSEEDCRYGDQSDAAA